jgi:hypothetical protein
MTYCGDCGSADSWPTKDLLYFHIAGVVFGDKSREVWSGKVGRADPVKLGAAHLAD